METEFQMRKTASSSVYSFESVDATDKQTDIDVWLILTDLPPLFAFIHYSTKLKSSKIMDKERRRQTKNMMNTVITFVSVCNIICI